MRSSAPLPRLANGFHHNLLSGRVAALVALLFSVGSEVHVRGQTAALGLISQTRTNLVRPFPTGFSYDVSTSVGPHHRRFERVELRADGSGQPQTNQYVEVASGLNYLNEAGDWVPADASFEVFDGAAVARSTTHKVIVASPPTQREAVDVLGPDGRRIVSRVLGITYYSPESGQTIWLGQVRECDGNVVGKNQVVFENAFDGGFRADIIYTLTRGGLEQDLLLVERPPSPAEFGLTDPDTRLEVVTELVEAPTPQVWSRTLKEETDTSRRARMHEADFVDEDLDFGALKMNQGRAFVLADGKATPDASIPVGKRLHLIDGRRILFEAVELARAEQHIHALPASRRASTGTSSGRKLASTRSELIKGQKVAFGRRSSMKLAMGSPPSRGFLVDYTLNAGSLTNFVFRGDDTYHVTGAVDLYATTTIEGGAVIKFNRDNPPNNRVWLRCNGKLVTKTSEYNPAFLTSVDDNSLGVVISGSTGSPSGTYAYYALQVDPSDACPPINNLRFFNANIGLQLQARTDFVARHNQFIDCGYGVSLANSAAARVENSLFHRSREAALKSSDNSNLTGEHLTINEAAKVFSATSGNCVLTNSLLVAITNAGSTYSSEYGATVATGTPVFTTSGGGSHYLSLTSPYRNAGTKQINPALALELRRRTTEPPWILPTTLAGTNILSPVVIPDVDAPDLGYHYDRVDFLAGNVKLTNSTVTLTNGVTVAVSGTEGFTLYGASKLISEGKPRFPCRIVGLAQIQENRALMPAQPISSVALKGDGGTPAEVRLRFTEMSQIYQRSNPQNKLIDVYYHGVGAAISSADTVFRGSTVFPQSYSGTTFFSTNCLFVHSRVYVSAATTRFFNNTMISGGLLFYAVSGQNITVKDNLFDGTELYTDIPATPTWNNSHNASVTNASGYWQLNPAGSAYVTLQTSPSYVTGPLGSHYLPAGHSLLNGGSRTAATAGLYHHTTTFDQAKEASSTVDIGFHYVATTAPAADVVWVEDATPAGATLESLDDAWTWTGSAPSPYSGSLAHQSSVFTGLHQHYFYNASTGIALSAEDSIFAYAYLDSGSPPSQAMLQWYQAGSWEHRAYWGQDLIYTNYSRIKLGELPAAASWVRLDIPVVDVGLAGKTITGMAFTLWNGRVTWDKAGIVRGFTNLPLADADGDGLADVAEDTNGNGSFDSGNGETDWSVSNSPLASPAAMTLFTPAD